MIGIMSEATFANTPEPPVSYWVDQVAAHAWKEVAAHRVAQGRGREAWYRDYRVRIATVDRDYSMGTSAFGD